MAVTDLWFDKQGGRTKRHGTGLRYRASWPGHRSRAFARKREAEEYEATLKLTPVQRLATTTVGELVDLWLAGKQGLADKSVTACKGDANHVKARWGGVRAGDVETHEIQAWIAGLSVEKGPKRARRTAPASEALRRRVYQCLHASLQIGVSTKVIAANPAVGVRVPRDHKREAQFLTVKQLAALAGAAGTKSALVWLLGTCGLRVGEACALRVAHVDDKRKVNKVLRPRLRVIKAKGKRGRDVPVPVDVLVKLDLDRPGTALVFTDRQGGPVVPDNFRKREWATALKATGMEGLHIHDLRHTAASLMISSGASVKAVQTALGHATATLTLDLYGHLFDDALDDVGSRMNDLLQSS